MIDSKGRVWMTSKIRGNTDPAWCSDPANKYADWFPLRNSGRQASFYDPKTQQFTLIDTCYSTHHLQFDNDPDETLYFNELSGPIFGWIDTKVYDQTARRAEGRSAGAVRCSIPTATARSPSRGTSIGARGGDDLLLSTDDTAGGAGTGSGAAEDAAGAQRRRRRFDPKLDTLVSYNLYSVIPSPVDDSVWGVSESLPGLPDPHAARQQSAGDLQDADLQGSGAGLRSARRGHRQQRRGLDRSGGHQPSGQLRRSQVQGPERPGEDRRQPVQRRLDALSDRRVRS